MGRDYKTFTYKSQRNGKKINFIWKLGVSRIFVCIVWYLNSEQDPQKRKKKKGTIHLLQSLSHAGHWSICSLYRPLGRLRNLSQIKKSPTPSTTFYLALHTSATLTSLLFHKHIKYAFRLLQLPLLVPGMIFLLLPQLPHFPPSFRSLLKYHLRKVFLTTFIKECLLPSILSVLQDVYP